MKKLIISSLLFCICSCNFVMNQVSFFPGDRETFSEDKLPPDVSEIFIETGDNVRLQAYSFRKKERGRRVIIYFHGNAGNLSHRVKDSLKLFKTGCDVLLVSYRGYGKSSGSPSEEGVYRDGEAALQYAQKNLGFKLSEIIIYGRSIGTTVAVYTAQRRDIAGLILITPLTSAEEFAEERGLSLFKGIAGDAFNSLSRINRVKVPLLVIHGDKDEVVPYVLGLRLYNAYQGTKKFVSIKGGGHNDLQKVDSRLYWSELYKFIHSR